MESLISTLGIDRLPEADRIQLVDEILESLGEDRELPPLTEAQAQEPIAASHDWNREKARPPRWTKSSLASPRTDVDKAAAG